MDQSIVLCRRRDLALLCLAAILLLLWLQVSVLDQPRPQASAADARAGSSTGSTARPAWSLPRDRSPARESRPVWSDGRGLAADAGDEDEDEDVFAANATLSFGGIVAVSTRSSKRRASLALAAELTGLHVSVPDQPVWSDETVADLRSQNGSLLSKGSAMSWLGHLNAIKWFVDQGWETALIMEDDVNWDIHLRHQQIPLLARALHEVVNREVREHGEIVHPAKRVANSKLSPSKGSIELRSNPHIAKRSTPNLPVPRPRTFWPDPAHWDLIYLGHCGDFFPAARLPDLAHSIFPDPSMSSPRGMHTDTQRFLAALPVPTRHRLVHQSLHPLCTFAYALTRAAAKRMLQHDAAAREQRGTDGGSASGTPAFDVRVLELCREGAYTCWSANPELLHHVDERASEIGAVDSAALSGARLGVVQREAPVDGAAQVQAQARARARARAHGTPNVPCGIRTLVERVGAGRGVRAMVRAAMRMDGVCPVSVEELDLLRGAIPT